MICKMCIDKQKHTDTHTYTEHFTTNQCVLDEIIITPERLKTAELWCVYHWKHSGTKNTSPTVNDISIQHTTSPRQEKTLNSDCLVYNPYHSGVRITQSSPE